MFTLKEKISMIILFSAMVFSWMGIFIKIEWFNHHLPKEYKVPIKYTIFTMVYILFSFAAFISACYIMAQ